MADDRNARRAYVKPPLGSLPDLDRGEKARSREAAAVPYSRIDADQRLIGPFRDLVDFAQRFLAGYGMDAAEIPLDSVHLMDGERMARVLELLSTSEENGGGVYDPRADVVYVRDIDPRDTLADLVKFYYRLAHEIGHKLTSALNKIFISTDHSLILTEGIADWFAQRFMQEIFLPAHAPDVAARIAETFRANPNPFELDGLMLRQDEILMVDADTGYGSPLVRVVELRIVKELARLMSTQEFSRLMQATTRENVDEVRRVVAETSGGFNLWSLLTTDPEQKPISEVLRKLSNSASISQLRALVSEPPVVG